MVYQEALARMIESAVGAASGSRDGPAEKDKRVRLSKEAVRSGLSVRSMVRALTASKCRLRAPMEGAELEILRKFSMRSRGAVRQRLSLHPLRAQRSASMP